MDHPKLRRDADGHLYLNFGDYGQQVEVAAISGNGRRVLTVSNVDIAHVCDVETGNLLAEIQPDSPLSGTEDTAPVGGRFHVFIESAALCHDGTFALLGLNDGTAVIYEVDGPQRLAVLHPPDQVPSTQWGVIRSVSYTADDLAVVGFPRRCVGVWSTDGQARIAFLDPESDRLVGRPFVRDTLISSVDVSSDGRHVFAGAVDMTALVYDVETGEVVFEATEHAEDIIALFDGPTGVGWATTGGSVWFRDKSGEVSKRLNTGEHWTEVTFERSGEGLLARGYGGSITRWNLAGERTLLFEPPAPTMGLWSDKAVTLGLDGTVAHYPESGRRVVVAVGDRRTVIQCDSQIVRVKLTPSAEAIAVDGWKNEVQTWDIASGRCLQSFPCKGGIGCFAFSPNGSLIAIGEIGDGGGQFPRHVFVYETGTGRLCHKLTEHEWQIKDVAFSPDGRRLASLGDELVVWDLEDIRRPCLRAPLDRTTGGFAFVDSELVVVEYGRVRVFDGATERLTFEAPIDFQTLWTVSSDGRHLCVAGNQSVFRYLLRTGQAEEPIVADVPRPDQIPPRSMAREHQIRAGAMLWRTEYGQFLHQSDGPRGWVQPLNLSHGRVALPCSSGAAIVHVTDGAAKLVGFTSFEGKLRAGHIVDGQSLMVNEKGQLFRESL